MYFVMLFSLPETVIKNIETLTKKGENMSIFVRGLLYSSILCRVCVQLFIFSVASIFCPILQIKRIFRILFKS